jgi:hypothetical protein
MSFRRGDAIVRDSNVSHAVGVAQFEKNRPYRSGGEPLRTHWCEGWVLTPFGVSLSAGAAYAFDPHFS